MKKISAKPYWFLLAGLFVISLLVISTCMMPELTPELYVGDLKIENAGEVNINKPDDVNIYGEEYLKITRNPALIYFTTDRNPGLDWYNAGLRVNLIKNDSTDGGDVTSECTFTPVIMTPGVKEITVSKESKTVIFSIAVLEITNSFNELLVSNPPAKTVYRPYESADWAGLEVTEVKYGGNPLIPPVTNIYTYPDSAITVSSLNLAPGPKIITVTKVDTAKTASFGVHVYDLTWYVEASGTGAGYTKDTPLPGVQEALSVINQAYTNFNNSWPPDSTGNKKQAAIVVSGEITKSASVSGDFVTVQGADAYPPILLKGNPGNPGKLNANGNGSVLYITDSNTVTLNEYLTLTGGGGGPRGDGYSDTMGGGVKVNGGTFNMTGGSIRDNSATFGGGVLLENNAYFHMTGGTINGNSGGYHSGGIGALSGSKFILDNGSISGNTAPEGPGVYLTNADFEMNGGIISANRGSSGGGVFFWFGTFTMTDGIINGNISGGVFSSRGIFNFEGGTISNNHSNGQGGGVHIRGGTLNMSGGIIRNNYAASDGGGLYGGFDTQSTKINKTGGVIESSNRSGSGIGNSVYIDDFRGQYQDGDSNRMRFDRTFDESTHLILARVIPVPYTYTWGHAEDIVAPPREYPPGYSPPENWRWQQDGGI